MILLGVPSLRDMAVLSNVRAVYHWRRVAYRYRISLVIVRQKIVDVLHAAHLQLPSPSVDNVTTTTRPLAAVIFYYSWLMTFYCSQPASRGWWRSLFTVFSAISIANSHYTYRLMSLLAGTQVGHYAYNGQWNVPLFQPQLMISCQNNLPCLSFNFYKSCTSTTENSRQCDSLRQFKRRLKTFIEICDFS